MKIKTGFIMLLSLLCVSVSMPLRAQDAAPKQGEVNRRLRRQNKRIKQGVKSGELTKSEAKELKTKDKAIHAEEHEMRKEDGGKLTQADKKELNQELNQNSKEIYQEKHDAEKR